MYVTLGGGITQHLLTASDKTIKASKVTWTTSNKKIATVSKSGKVTGKKKGTVTIKAKYKGKTYKCKAYVKYATKKYSSISLKVGDTAKQIIYAASGNPASTSKVKFTVEKGKENIATVNNEGLITAVSEGTVKIYAEYFGVKYKATVSVSPNEQKQEEQKEEEKKEESQQQPATPPAGGGGGGGAGGGSTTSGGGTSSGGGSGSTPSGGGGSDTPAKPTEPEIIKYTVSFNPNGGGGVMDSKEIEKDKEYTLPDCVFDSPAGQKFKAWNVNGSEYAIGKSIKITKDTLVKAVWEDNIYTVSFVSNGGSGTMSSVKVKHGESYMLPSNGFDEPSGQGFKAWNVNGEEKKPGDSISVTKDITIKAIWQVEEKSMKDASYAEYKEMKANNTLEDFKAKFIKEYGPKQYSTWLIKMVEEENNEKNQDKDYISGIDF